MSRLDAAEKKIGWRQRRLGGVDMTALQFLVLQELKTQDDDGCPALLLDLDGKTIRSLLRKDLIRIYMHIDGDRFYAITERGKCMVRRFARTDYRRNDGICPRCGENPKRVRKNGTLGPYCPSCENRIYHRKYELGIVDRKPGLCKCGKREKVITPSGYVKTYCKVCERRKRKTYKRNRSKRLRKRIEAGERILCSCGEGELYIQPSGRVTDRCPECLRKYMDAYNRKRRSG